MPKLGAYTDDVLLAAWHVGEGEAVERGAVVLELETEKTTADVEAEGAGFVHRLVPAGEAVPIGTTVALIAETRAEYDEITAGAAGAEGESETNGNPFLGYIGQGGGASAVQATVPPTAPAPAAPHRTGRAGAPLVSPRARKLLGRLGFSLDHAAQIAGSGPGGRVLDRDIVG